MLLGAALLGFLSARLSKRVLVAWSLVIIGLFLAGIGVAPAFGLIIAISFGIGVMLVPAQSGLMAMMQLAVPDLKRGRVGSTLNALTTAAGLLSMAAAASLADQIGPRPIYVICGLIVAAGGLVGLAVLKEPKLQPIRQPIDQL
jgi:MFS family permease